MVEMRGLEPRASAMRMLRSKPSELHPRFYQCNYSLKKPVTIILLFLRAILFRASIFRLVWLAISAAVIVGVWAFGHFVYDNPTNVFYGMISNALTTTGYIEKLGSANLSYKSTKYVLVQTGANNITESIDILTGINANHYNIKTESIGTPVYDYQRFVRIQNTASQRSINYRPLLNLWGLNPSDPNVTNGQLFNETLLGIIPIGQVSSSERSALMNQIKVTGVYQIEKIAKTHVNGRLAYVYTIKLNSLAYLLMLKQFGLDLGLNQLKNINPNNLGQNNIPPLNLTIDVLSRQLIAIGLPNEVPIETFSSFGINQHITTPKNAISISSLENKFNQVTNANNKK